MPVLFLFVLATWQYRCSQGLGDGRFLQTAFNSGAEHPARTCTPSTRFHFAPRQSTASPNNPGLQKIGPWHDGMSQMYIQYHPMLSYDVMSMCCVVLAFEPLAAGNSWCEVLDNSGSMGRNSQAAKDVFAEIGFQWEPYELVRPTILVSKGDMTVDVNKISKR